MFISQVTVEVLQLTKRTKEFGFLAGVAAVEAAAAATNGNRNSNCTKNGSSTTYEYIYHIRPNKRTAKKKIRPWKNVKESVLTSLHNIFLWTIIW